MDTKKMVDWFGGMFSVENVSRSLTFCLVIILIIAGVSMLAVRPAIADYSDEVGNRTVIVTQDGTTTKVGHCSKI